jgi:hypothetical protein
MDTIQSQIKSVQSYTNFFMFFNIKLPSVDNQMVPSLIVLQLKFYMHF